MESIIIVVWLLFGVITFSFLMRCVDATIAHDQKFAKLCDSEHLTTFRGRITLFVICEILWPIVAGQLVIAAVVRALRIVQARWLRWRICVAAQKLSDAICRAEAESDTDEGRKSLNTALQTLKDSGFEITVVDDDGNDVSATREKE